MLQDAGLIYSAGTLTEHFQYLAISVSDGDSDLDIGIGSEFAQDITPRTNGNSYSR
jgi:hypothetical protein